MTTRLFVLLLLVGAERSVRGDVQNYALNFQDLSEVGWAETLVVYPLPAVVLLSLPWRLSEGLGSPESFLSIMAILALALDGLFTWLLYRSSGSGRNRGLWVWLLAVPALGATTFARFDLWPGMLAGLAVLLFSTRPGVAAAAVALGTGIKLWPGLFLPALAARRRERTTVMVVALGVGAALAVGSLLLAGWERLLSPLEWQSERGLHIESVLATPAALAWAGGADGYTTELSLYSIDVGGPGVDLLQSLSSVLTAVGALALVAMWVAAWWRQGGLTRDAVAWMCLASVMYFLVSSKALSPQYMLWALPAAAAALAVAETARGLERLTSWCAWLLAAAVATQIVYPIGYAGIFAHRDWSIWITVVLAVRNAILVWLLACAAREVWWHLRSPAQRPLQT